MGYEGSNLSEQLERLQTLMHRLVFHSYISEGKLARNPYRGQGRVLAALAQEPEISQKDLTRRLGMSKQSLAELLGKLEKGGMISRAPSEKDKRSVIVRLLPEGRRAARELGDSSHEIEALFDCLNEEEAKQLGEYLSRIIERCAETFPGEDHAERRSRMENFLSNHNYSFRRIELSAAVAAEHKKRTLEGKELKEAQKEQKAARKKS